MLSFFLQRVLLITALARQDAPVEAEHLEPLDIIAVVVRKMRKQVKPCRILGQAAPEVAEIAASCVFGEAIGVLAAHRLVVLLVMFAGKIPVAEQALYRLHRAQAVFALSWLAEGVIELVGTVVHRLIGGEPICDFETPLIGLAISE